MNRAYGFADLVKLSGLSSNEAKYITHRKVIRPDVKATRGSGNHAAYGFLDVFEGRIVSRLYQLPGSTPIDAVSRTLDNLRVLTELDTLNANPGWSRFLDPSTRDTSPGYFLCLRPGGVTEILDGPALAAWIAASTEATVTIRLDTLLLELEAATGDHATSEERLRVWNKTIGRHGKGASNKPRGTVARADEARAHAR